VTAPQTPATDIDFAPLGYFKPGASKTIDIVRFTLSIWRRLTLGLIVGLTLGVLYYLKEGPIYEADTRVLVSQKSAIREDDRKPNFSGERTEHVHLIMSDAIVRRAYESHGLKEHPAFAGAYYPVLDIIESLAVKRSAGQDHSFVNLLDISYLHPDKDAAKKVVEAIVAAYADYLEDTRRENSQELFEILSARQKELEREIDEQERTYLDFRDKSPFYLSTPPTVTVNGNVMAGKNPYQEAVEQLQAERRKTRARQSDVHSRIATLKQLMESGEARESLEFFVMHWLAVGTKTDGEGGGGGGNSPLITEPPAKAELDRLLLDVHVLLGRLRAHLGEDHPNVKKLRTQIATLFEFYREKGLTPPNVDEQLASQPPHDDKRVRLDIVTAYIRIMEKELMHLEDFDRRLEDDLQAAELRAKQASLFEVQDQKRKAEITRKKEEWQKVIAQLDSFGSQKDQEGYRLKQIAQVRVGKSMKRVIKIVGAFGVFGLAAVFGLTYFREWQDTTLKTLDELRLFLGGMVIGEVPQFRAGSLFDRSATASAFDPALCYYHRPGSREAEAFRSVRTSLSIINDDGKSKVIQVTSPEPGDGKSVSASNLALALAQSGKRVLLVDADLRRPTVHQLFRLPQEIGLTEALQGEIEWLNAVKQTQVDGLGVLAAGRCPANPAELLSIDALPRILSAARDEYDYVLVDAPPVLAVSDPCIIARHVDGLLLVIRMQKNKRAAIEHARDTLQAHGVRLYGVIANGLDARAGYAAPGYDKYYTTADVSEARTRPVTASELVRT
jgi:capsular exopolysaccharide synthesis family protein